MSTLGTDFFAEPIQVPGTGSTGSGICSDWFS
jgi:hypothetical protein